MPAFALMNLVLLSVLAVPAIPQTPSPDVSREREESYIYAAIVRHVVEGKRGILFLRIARKDPSDAVLGRVIRFGLEVVPASRAIPEKPESLLEPLKWRDRKTGLSGELLDLDGVEWVTQKRVRVGSNWVGRLGKSYPGNFVVVKEAGRWRVRDFEEGIYSY